MKLKVQPPDSHAPVKLIKWSLVNGEQRSLIPVTLPFPISATPDWKVKFEAHGSKFSASNGVVRLPTDKGECARIDAVEIGCNSDE